MLTIVPEMIAPGIRIDAAIQAVRLAATKAEEALLKVNDGRTCFAVEKEAAADLRTTGIKKNDKLVVRISVRRVYKRRK